MICIFQVLVTAQLTNTQMQFPILRKAAWPQTHGNPKQQLQTAKTD